MCLKDAISFAWFLLLCTNWNNVLCDINPTDLDCSVREARIDNVTELICVEKSVDGKSSHVTADSLRRVNISDSKTGKAYTLIDCPHRIDAFSLQVRGNLTISENAFQILSNFSTFEFGELEFSGLLVSYTIVIPIDEFKNTPHLKKLQIRHVDVFPGSLEFLRSAPQLEHLELQFSRIKELTPDTFRKTANLESLKITTFRPFAIQEGTFDGLTRLRSISLVGNKNITTLRQVLPKDAKNLAEMRFRDNAITKIPSGSFSGIHLRQVGWQNQLDLSENPITVIEPGAFDNLENLSLLNLNNCPIEDLPGGVFGSLKNLTVLNLANTRISRIRSTSFSGLNSLERLNLQQSELLTTIEPDAFADLVNLTFLDFSLYRIMKESNLRVITSTAFRGLRRLESLDLDWNDALEEIEPGAFDDLINLRDLSMRHTNVTTLPDGLFANMKKLEKADFRGNRITNLSPGNFTHCPNLKRLWIDKSPN